MEQNIANAKFFVHLKYFFINHHEVFADKLFENIWERCLTLKKLKTDKWSKNVFTTVEECSEKKVGAVRDFQRSVEKLHRWRQPRANVQAIIIELNINKEKP